MKKLLVLLLSIFCIMLIAGQTSATTLSFLPSSQEITFGDSTSVDLIISGLGDFQAPSLGAFLLDVLYDPDILSFTSVDFGLFLGDPALFEADIFYDNSTPGVVSLDEVSWLDADPFSGPAFINPYLDEIQGKSFSLATLTFTGKGLGTSALDFGRVDLSDAFGVTLVPTTADGSIKVAPVPEPATILLLVSGMAGLGVFGRKRFKKQKT